MKIKTPQFFLLTLVILALNFKVQANIFDEDDQNTIDQNSLNQLSTELEEMSENKTLTQIYLPETSKNEWMKENKVAQDSEENIDEVKRKEAAIMRDLDEHARPIEGVATENQETKEDPQEKVKEESVSIQKETPKFKPRQRSR